MATLFCIGLLVAAASAGATPTSADPAAGLVQAERQWMEAMRLRDGPALRRTVAPEFKLSGAGDLSRPPVPAATWLDNALRHLKTEAFRFDDIRAQVTGEVGIVRASYRWSGAYDDERFDDKGALVDVWVRRNGRWVVISRVIADPPPTPPATPAAP